MKKAAMTIDGKIRDEKLWHNIYREVENIPALSSCKIDKYEYFTCEEILPPDQSQKIQQTNFLFLTLRRAFKKQTKTI